MRAFAALVALVIALMIPASAHASLFINEFLADPPSGSDANNDGNSSSSQDEFVELHNNADTAVSLADWGLSDGTRLRHVFGPAAAISPYGVFVVFGGGNPVADYAFETASTGTLSLNNTADSVALHDAAGALVDFVEYGSEAGNDVSLARGTAGGPFALHNTIAQGAYSPGSAFSAPEQPPEPPASASSVVPEPATGLAFALGCTLFGRQRRRFRV